MTEELKNPNEDLPRAIITAITLVTACYLGVNVAYLSVLSPDAMSTSEAVAVVRLQELTGLKLTFERMLETLF